MSNSLRLILPGTSMDRGVGYSPAVSEGLLSFHYYGGTAAASNKNLAARNAPAAVSVGSPTFQPSYAIYNGGANYQQQPVFQTLDMTVLMVMRAGTAIDAAGRAISMVSNQSSSPTVGMYLGLLFAGGNPTLRADYHVVGGGQARANLVWSGAASGPSPWVMLAALFDGGASSTRATVRNLTSGQQATTLLNTAPSVSAAPFLVGGGPTAGATSSLHVAHESKWNRLLSEDELVKQCNQIALYLSGLPEPDRITDIWEPA